MSSQPKTELTTEEYLAIEREAEIKHEYYRGEMFAMGGASHRHNLVSGNVFADIHSELKERDCQVFTNDMRVKVCPTGLYTYPDVIVTCEQPQFEDNHFDTLLNPQVIIEVLSDSTEQYDRGKKFEYYRQLASLKEYVLVSQDHAHIERFSHQDGKWVLSEATGLDAALELPSVDCQLKLADVYAKVEFEKSA